MERYDLFLSYASKDLDAAETLERWLLLSPRNHTVWRDRRGILPGAPDYYPPIVAGIHASGAFLLLLSPRWLESKVAAQELTDAQAVGKKIIVAVHPAIPRDPETEEGRSRKRDLEQALKASGLATLERPNWIWTLEKESSDPDYTGVEQALKTDFAWANRHTIIVQCLDRWKSSRDGSALLRGRELEELMADAFADAQGREPGLTEEQRSFLLESQRHGAAERASSAARERGEAEPDAALLLAAEAASVPTVPEARGILLSLLHRHAMLTRVIDGHGTARRVSGLALSPDGRWLASIDEARALGDERPSHLLVHDAETGREGKRVNSNERLSAVAWGSRWLAVASPGSIGWLRWDDLDDKFRGNTPSGLEDGVIPRYLAFSPPGVKLPDGEWLAWGSAWGDIGLIRVGDHLKWQGRLSDDRSSDALTGLGWLTDGRLISAEGGRLLLRSFPDMEPVHEISAPGQVFSLHCDGERWVAACRRNGSAGLLLGKGMEEEVFLPMTAPDLGLIAAWAGPADDPWILTGSSVSRSGVPAVMLWQGEAARETLLQGDEEPVSCVAADPSGRFVAAGGMGGRVWLWDRHRRSHLVGEARPGADARCIAASSTGRSALATQDGRILVFGPGFDGDPVADVPAPFPPVRLKFADGGQILLAVAADGQIATLGDEGVVQIQSWPPELGEPKVISVASDAPTIAALGSDNTIAILRLTESSFRPMRTIDVGELVVGLALDPSGEQVFAVVERLGLDVVSWPVYSPDSTPDEVVMIQSGLPPVPIAFSGEQIVVIGDGFDLLFVPQDASETATRRGSHDEPVRLIAAGAGLVASVACSFQDTRVDQIRLWTNDGQLLGAVTLPEHAADIVVCPDARSIMVLGLSGTLWSTTLRAEVWIETARRIAGRSLSAEERRRYDLR